MVKKICAALSSAALALALAAVVPARVLAQSGGLQGGQLLTNGQVLIGSTGGAPAAGTITGTSGAITVTNGANSITVAVPAQPVLSSLIVTGSAVIGSASQVANSTLQVGSNSAAVIVNSNGKLELKGTAPTLGSCGTGPSVVSGNDQAGDFTLGSAGVTTCTLTFATGTGNIAHCFAANRTILEPIIPQATASTIVFLGSASGAQIGNTNNIIDYGCLAHQ